VYLNNFRMY